MFFIAEPRERPRPLSLENDLARCSRALSLQVHRTAQTDRESEEQRRAFEQLLVESTVRALEKRVSLRRSEQLAICCVCDVRSLARSLSYELCLRLFATSTRLARTETFVQ